MAAIEQQHNVFVNTGVRDRIAGGTPYRVFTLGVTDLRHQLSTSLCHVPNHAAMARARHRVLKHFAAFLPLWDRYLATRSARAKLDLLVFLRDIGVPVTAETRPGSGCLPAVGLVVDRTEPEAVPRYF